MSGLGIALAMIGAAAPAQTTDDVLRTYIACAAKRGEVQMQQLLDARAEAEYRKAAQAFTEDPRCMVSDDVTTTVVVSTFNQDRGKFRGMVAESLVNRSKTAARLGPVAKAPAYSASWFGFTSRVQAVDEMAMCVAMIDPAGIRGLLATRPNSAGQKQAFAALTPSLGTCLAKGYQLDTKPPALRAALAEALYHRDRDGGVK
ncbi:MAG: hypothetical protein ACKOOL_04495 [Novosphingobium sp.]